MQKEFVSANKRIKIEYEVLSDVVKVRQLMWSGRGWRLGNTILLPRDFIRHLTPLALDGANAPDNQQVLPTDVLEGEGTLPEPPRQ